MSGIEHRHLRSALEFAVLMAGEAQKRKPAMAYPKALKPYLGKTRLPSASLGRLRRAVEADPQFRSRIAAGALPELVDDIGRLWLQQPDGWEQQGAELAARLDEAAASDDLAAQLRRSDRRREAAEAAAVRARAEVLRLTDVVDAQATELHELRAEVAKADEAVREMTTELVDVRVEIRHARDREAAAVERAEQLRGELDAVSARIGDGGADGAAHGDDPGRVELPEDVAERLERLGQLDDVAAAARSLAARLDDLAGGQGAPATPDAGTRPTGRERTRPERRTPLSLPGGLISTSAAAAEFLLRSDAAVLIDGYNVAKLGWPDISLEQQRHRLLDAVENLARRHGTDVTVVFDGASIVGAHADRRRLARVVFSPAGVTADDVIRDEVRRLPTSRSVVVVTNDAEIVDDVKRAGGNVIPSNALLAVI